MGESEAIQTVVTQVTIQASSTAVIVMKEADASIQSAQEKHGHKHGRPV